MRGRVVGLFLGAVGIMYPAIGTGGEVPFTRIDLPTQEDHSWGDVRVGNLNNDQHLDIQAGMQWFEGPTWVRHRIGPNPTNIFGTGTSVLHDLDGDDDLDILTYITDPYRYVWYENPGPPATGEWDRHTIRQIPDGWPEGKLIVDIDGNDKDDLITLEKDGSGIQVAEIPANPESAAAWHFTQISNVSAHGLGLGDLNQDSRLDLVADYQWIEQNANGSWTDHVIPQRPTGYRATETTSPLVHDLDGDGDIDIFLPRAHNYGAYWLESSGGSNPVFTLHSVLPGQLPSQFYGAAYADIDDDGDMDIFGGQCHYVHSDPGEDDEPDIFWIESIPNGVSGGTTWVKHQLSTELKMGRSPSIADIDDDGDLDLVSRPIGFGGNRMLPPRDQFDVNLFLNQSDPDDIPPTVERAVSTSDPSLIVVVFSEPVEQSSAETAANYGLDNQIQVDSAQLDVDPKTVILKVSPALAVGITYWLTINGVKDRATRPNTIAPNTRIAVTFEPIQNAKVNFQPLGVCRA